MMAKILDLPVELLEEILILAGPPPCKDPNFPRFERPYNKDEQELYREIKHTCRAFRDIVPRVVGRRRYEFLSARHSGLGCPEAVIWGIDKLHDLLSENPKLGGYCRVFKVSLGRGNFEIRDKDLGLLDDIFSFLPKAEKLDIGFFTDILADDEDYFPRGVLRHIKNVSNLVEIHISAVSPSTITLISRVEWPPSAKKLHLTLEGGYTHISDDQMCEDNETCNFTSLCLNVNTRVDKDYVAPILNRWPKRLEELSFFSIETLEDMPSILGRHKNSLLTLTVGFLEIWTCNSWYYGLPWLHSFRFSDFTALEHLTLIHRHETSPECLKELFKEGADRFLGPRLKNLTWVIAPEKHDETTIYPHAGAVEALRKLATVAIDRKAALEEIRLIFATVEDAKPLIPPMEGLIDDHTECLLDKIKIIYSHVDCRE